jgi:hypothetical protein
MADEAITLGSPDLSGPEDAVRRPRRKRWLIIATIVVMVVAVPVGVVLYGRHTLRNAEKDLAEVRASLPFKLVPAKDLPTLWGPPPAPEDNAAPVYQQAFDLVDPPDAWQNDEPSVAETASEFLTSLGYEEPRASETPPEPDYAAARQFVERHRKALALRDRAIGFKGYRVERDWSLGSGTPMEDLSGFMALAELTLLEAAIRWHDGDRVEAFGLMRALLEMARHVEAEPATVPVLVGAAMRGMAADALARFLSEKAVPEEHADALRRLLRYDPREKLRSATVSETVIINDDFRAMMDGRRWVEDYIRGEHWDHKGEQPLPMRVGLDRIREFATRNFALFLQLMVQHVEACDKPLPELLREFERLEGVVDKKRILGFQGKPSIVFRRFPAMLGIARELAKYDVRSEMAIVAMVLAEQREQSGTLPEKLADLPHAESLSSDPFSGKPFHYRREGDGFVLWSVGPDGDDDGGKTAKEMAGEYVSDLMNDGDIVLRVRPVSAGSGESSSE